MKRKNKVRWEFFGLFLWALLILGVGGVWLAIKIRASDGNSETVSEKITQLYFSLSDVTLAEMKAGSKKTEYLGNKLTLKNSQQKTEFAEVKLEGRGNTTWAMQKKPWQIKLKTKEELLEGREAKKWAMLANYADASFMRNDIALKLAEMTGVSFSRRGDFVEAYFDNENEGLYYLVPKIEVEKGGVELKDRLGILVELDDLHSLVDNSDICYYSYLGDCLYVEDAVSNKNEEVKEEAMGGFLRDFNKLGLMLEQKNYEGVKELIDIESMAKYFLVSEFTVNPDAYVTSFYFYKDGNEDKIHVGPVWDFDLAFANQWWNGSNNPNYYSPTETMARRTDAFYGSGEKVNDNMSYLVYDLMEFPEFQDEIKRVFRENLSGRKNEFLIYYDLTVEKIKKAAERDIALWREKEPSDKDFERETAWLRDWIEARYDYFEQVYGAEERRGAV